MEKDEPRIPRYIVRLTVGVSTFTCIIIFFGSIVKDNSISWRGEEYLTLLEIKL